MINRLVIVGVGLIGGSLALALKKAKFVRNIIGVVRSDANLNIVRDLKIVDEVVLNLSEAVVKADLVVLAAPLSATRHLFAELRPILSKKTILTDVKSNLFSSNDNDLDIVIQDALDGKVGALITNDFNLAYHYPKSKVFLGTNDNKQGKKLYI